MFLFKGPLYDNRPSVIYPSQLQPLGRIQRHTTQGVVRMRRKQHYTKARADVKKKKEKRKKLENFLGVVIPNP